MNQQQTEMMEAGRSDFVRGFVEGRLMTKTATQRLIDQCRDRLSRDPDLTDSDIDAIIAATNSESDAIENELSRHLRESGYWDLMDSGFVRGFAEGVLA